MLLFINTNTLQLNGFEFTCTLALDLGEESPSQVRFVILGPRMEEDEGECCWMEMLELLLLLMLMVGGWRDG